MVMSKVLTLKGVRSSGPPQQFPISYSVSSLVVLFDDTQMIFEPLAIKLMVVQV